MPSGQILVILLTIILELKIFVLIFEWRVVGNVLIKISPSILFLTLVLPTRFHQRSRLRLATVSITGLISKLS